MIRAQANDQHRARVIGTFAVSRFRVTATKSLKHISNFFRRLHSPVMNQLLEIELNTNTEQSIL